MTNTEKIALLKNQLLEELQKKENPDVTRLLSFSSELAKLDDSQIRFSVDAGIINRLGKELVARSETAVSELVKNAYDADATEVELIFENALQPGGTLYIQDNGVGMTREQLINGFMRLASSDKIHNPTSLRYHRLRAGKKGIGRFATQRLGKKLTIVTQTLDSTEAIKVTIDWDSFAVDTDLTFIPNTIELVSKTKPEGTDFTIKDLREAWSDTAIKRAFRFTSELLQPFPLSKRRKDYEEDKVDAGFKSYYYRKQDNELISIIDEEKAFFNFALAEIEGYVTEDGHGKWTLKSDKLNFSRQTFSIGKDENDEKSTFKYLKNVRFKCYYFLYESSLLPSQTLTMIKNAAEERSGIKLYRNGFRVPPYGEKNDDWLRLDESTRRRAVLPTHSNKSFFGFVEVLDDEQHKLYEETASREGLIKNEAFNELGDFVHRVIIATMLKIAALRGRKGKAGQKDWKRTEITPSEKVDASISELVELIESDESNSEEVQNNEQTTSRAIPKEQIKQALARLKEERVEEKKTVEEEKTALIDELNMLRVLGGIGLVIGEFVHEVKRFLPAFDVDISYLKKIIAGNAEALKRAERLEINLASFTSYTSYFDSTISQNNFRQLQPIDVQEVVLTFRDIIQNDYIRSGISFLQPMFEDFDLSTIPMHRSEWASVLFNLYTNAKKAIIKAAKADIIPQTEGKIYIRCGREHNFIFLEFSDNGIGIPPENEERIFDAFFTTSLSASYSNNDADALSGTGLGLKIVKDIIESYNGNIYVTQAISGFTTTMRIEIPEFTQ